MELVTHKNQKWQVDVVGKMVLSLGWPIVEREIERYCERKLFLSYQFENLRSYND